MEQRNAYDKITFFVDSDEGGFFFVVDLEAPRRLFYIGLLATVRGQSKIVVATTTS